jgi:hypothetical protein
MTEWRFRSLMAIMAVWLTICVYSIIIYKPPQAMCLNGIVMVPDKGGDMWVQKGLWATYCIPVDKD